MNLWQIIDCVCFKRLVNLAFSVSLHITKYFYYLQENNCFLCFFLVYTWVSVYKEYQDQAPQCQEIIPGSTFEFFRKMSPNSKVLCEDSCVWVLGFTFVSFYEVLKLSLYIYRFAPYWLLGTTIVSTVPDTNIYWFNWHEA